MEAVRYGMRRNLDRLHDQDRHVEIDWEIISPIAVVRDLGMYLNGELSIKQHLNRIATCFFHLWRLQQICCRTGRDLTVQLILAFITMRLDYCNCVQAGLPQTTLAPLRTVHPKRGSMARLWAPWLWACHTVSNPAALATGSLEDLLQAMHNHPSDTGRCPAYMKEIVHSQQHNSTSWTTLGSVKFNQLCRSTTMHEFQQMRVLLCQSSRVEFTSSTCPRRDGLSSIITLKDFLRHTLLV